MRPASSNLRTLALWTLAGAVFLVPVVVSFVLSLWLADRPAGGSHPCSRGAVRDRTRVSLRKPTPPGDPGSDSALVLLPSKPTGTLIEPGLRFETVCESEYLAVSLSLHGGWHVQPGRLAKDGTHQPLCRAGGRRKIVGPQFKVRVIVKRHRFKLGQVTLAPHLDSGFAGQDIAY